MIFSLLADIPAPEEFRNEKLRITPLEFEKDDDSNGHIDFIVGKLKWVGFSFRSELRVGFSSWTVLLSRVRNLLLGLFLGWVYL